jgi:Protein of unknown function (DUF3137)
MQHQELFDKVMNSGLRDWLDEQSSVREEAKREEIRRFVFGGAVALIAGLIVFIFSGGQVQFTFIIACLVLAGTWYSASLPVQEVTQQIKVKANEELGAALGFAYRAGGEAGPDFLLATQMGLLPTNPDRSYFNDFWTGRFGTCEGQLHEALLQEYSQNGKNRRLETVFRGVIIGYQFARPFSSTTLVKPDQGMFNGLANFASRFSGLSLEPVKMVHPDFENQFEVTSNDQVEARYLLHPAFCERLMDTVKAFAGENMRMAFAQGRVILVIETNDLFESGGIDADGDEERLANTIEQIGSLIELTQTLNERPRA